MRETREEIWTVLRPKRCDGNIPNEDSSPSKSIYINNNSPLRKEKKRHALYYSGKKATQQERINLL